MIPSFTHLHNIFQYASTTCSQEMLAHRQYKFSRILEHPKLSLEITYHNFWPYTVMEFIKSHLLSEQNLDKLLSHARDNESYVIFSRDCIEWIKEHPELEWIKSHPFYSEKAYEKNSLKDLIEIACNKTYDDDVKKILQIALKVIENPEAELVFDDSEYELEEMIWRYK